MFKSIFSKVFFAFLVSLAILAAGLYVVGCSDDDSSTSPEEEEEPEITYDLYVDVNSGSDSYPGTEAQPFKTITHAFSVAVAHDSIKVAPGTYDVNSGEVFPIYFPDSVDLIGDITNRGMGTTPTKIEGVGNIDINNDATIVGGEASTISGFNVVQPTASIRFYCIVSDNVDFNMVDNTFNSNYGCLKLINGGDPLVKDNVLWAPYYGVQTLCTGNPVIRDNLFTNGTYISSANGDPVIKNNNFDGDSYSAIIAQNNEPVIDSNSMTGSYSRGAVLIQRNAYPRVRNCTFTVISGICVGLEDTSRVDLGTALDHGNNVFTGTGGVALFLETDSLINAIGNTWYNTPPACGTEISFEASSTGKVVYGTGPTDTCSASKL